MFGRDVIPGPAAAGETVVARLGRGIQQAKAAGFEVRLEHLGDGQAGWCQVGQKRILFLDASETAGEQLHQLRQALTDFQNTAAELRAAA